MAKKCPSCNEELKTANLVKKGQEVWCKNCNRQLVKKNVDGSLSFWMPPLQVDKNGNKSLPKGWSFEPVEDIVAVSADINLDAELTPSVL